LATPLPEINMRRALAGYYGMISELDEYIGQVWTALEQTNQLDNTIFVFTADNGPEAVPNGTNTVAVQTANNGSAGPFRGTLFTGFEGSLRVPFVIRWPGKIPAGVSSNEIVHEMDLFTTFAEIAGGEVPDDRIIDGIDMSAFFLGEQDKSGREGVIVYNGEDIFGVKWGNWKVNFKEQETVFDEIRTYGTPRVYNLLTDPGESQNVLFPHTWVPKAALVQLGEHYASLEREPPIRPGTLDPYLPAR